MDKYRQLEGSGEGTVVYLVKDGETEVELEVVRTGMRYRVSKRSFEKYYEKKKAKV